MPKRKPLSKKIRFEVFKRDMFTCQYCGAKAPDVLLEVDHIVPVKEGGSDDILNLITSCRNCNRGKSSVKLSDNTVIQKKQKQAEELQERREQLELMYEWHKQLLEETEIEVNSLQNLLKSYYPSLSFKENGVRTLKKLIKNFGYSEVYESFEIALNYYDDAEEAFNKIGGICYNRQQEKRG